MTCPVTKQQTFHAEKCTQWIYDPVIFFFKKKSMPHIMTLKVFLENPEAHDFDIDNLFGF